MLQELELLYKKSKSNIENIVRQCNESERKLDKLQTDFTTMESICSNIQIFHSVQKFKTDISELKNEIQEITKRDDNKKVELKLNLDPKCLDGTVIHSFGEIKLDEHAFGDFFHWFKGKNSQILDIENITLKRNLDVDLSDIVGDSFILGCCYGDDGTILIASRDNARIIVLREDGTYDREIKMQDELNKIVFAKGKIYVSSYSKQSLTSVDFSTGQIIKKVKFDNICDALALANECLIINVVKKEYRIYNLDLEYIGTIPIKSGTTAHHVSYLNMKIYFAESSPEICVSCYDIRGTLQWKCQDENLPLISGCTVDGRGNVFGAGFLENNIVIISSNGTKWKIATQLVNMKRSTAVYCDRHRGRLLVISDISPRLQEYEIQY